ncbi:hypothetical protein HYX17_02525 [Candidatus Woesearchaeota archaeon]|nr:hypothetical protein [Candidatus Woesearchaeota archaeon]
MEKENRDVNILNMEIERIELDKIELIEDIKLDSLDSTLLNKNFVKYNDTNDYQAGLNIILLTKKFIKNPDIKKGIVILQDKFLIFQKLLEKKERLEKLLFENKKENDKEFDMLFKKLERASNDFFIVKDVFLYDFNYLFDVSLEILKKLKFNISSLEFESTEDQDLEEDNDDN